MFSSIAGRYDRANAVLSFGVHRLWRRRAVLRSGARPGDAVLDCATGTGDLAIAFKKRVGATGRVVGTDFNADMLAAAPRKAARASVDVAWEVQDAMRLGFPDASFDVSSIAFGIRNVDDPAAALGEMARVVRPGGHVVVLEFGTPRAWMRPFFSAYSAVVIPVVGGLVSGNREAYRYLTRTSAAFPTGDAFLALMRSTGRFAAARTEPLTGGIAYLYIGTVA
jgi:demethylmenaquinone methyltransferase/2-methoxy-6-polyprenyl-1,4-benzoquinol methylase